MWRRYLKFIEAVTVFAEFHHAAKHQYSSALADEAVGSTAWWDVTSHSREEPLLGDWKSGRCIKHDIQITADL